jgi:hypothetical protein
VCSITINNTVDQQLAGLVADNDNVMIEQRLIALAREASLTQSGPLDVAGLTRMPPELKTLRKKRIGRHRVFYVGHHTKCTYHALYVKEFKRFGKNDEDDRKFQKALARALAEPPTRTLTEPTPSP